MAETVRINHAALRQLLFDPRVAKELLTTAASIARVAYTIAPKRQPRHQYAASIREEIEVTPTGPVAYVSADVDAIKIEFGTEDTPRFRPLGRAVEMVAARDL